MNIPNSTFHSEHQTLAAHVRECQRDRDLGFVLRCVGERLHAVLAPRFVTTVLGAVALMVLLAGHS